MTTSKTKIPMCFLLLAVIILGYLGSSASARVLLDNEEAGSAPDTVPLGTTSISDTEAVDDVLADPPLPDTAPVADVAPDADVVPIADVEPVASPAGSNVVPNADVAQGQGQGQGQRQAELTFFMHDIVGGSHPSVRTVTGVITSTALNAVPFSKPANNIFPLTGGVPLLNGANPNQLNQVINNNNLPFLTGLNPGGIQSTTIIQNSGNNNQVTGGNNQPFVSAGQLPAGATIQNLMFGTITVIDDELTEEHELGSAVLGKAQGFYLASSLDGTSHTMAITLMFHGNDQEIVDTISLFGVHRTVSPDSQVAIVGGTGKYEHAKGYVTVETLPQVDQHTTDGIESILQFSVYFSEE